MRNSIFLLLALSLCYCANKNATDDIVAPDGAKITINPGQTFQTIDHFGASDAWSGQFVGAWPDSKRNAIADLLFSNDTSSTGQPLGIGLSLWRFNIGAGTAEQGSASGISDEWRRAESFLSTDGTYNWNKQAGQIWLLKAAKQRGVPYTLAFPNSPPVALTVNKKGSATGGQPNLASGNFGKFASYLGDVISGVKAHTGITFDYISPVNEPQWDWSDGGQEGTPFYNNQVAQIVKALSSELQNRGLSTKIDVAEAGQIDYLYSESNKQGRGNQIQDFFSPASENYIGNLSGVSSTISGHSYFTTSPGATAQEKRQALSKKLAEFPNLKYWMSEYCILGDNAGEINGVGKDLGIASALYIARVIHTDLTVAGASAWHWWLAISPYDYKDGLIYIDKNKEDGQYQSSKMLWALGQYSKFIRPNAKRVGLEISRSTTNLYASAYRNTDNSTVCVLINPGSTAVSLDIEVNGLSKQAKIKQYVTSASGNMAPVSSSGTTITVAPGSIHTIIWR